MKPKISIIVPIRNRADLFKPTLESYVSQTLPPDQFEIVIVDQQSNDGLIDLLNGYHCKLNFKLYDVDVNSGTIKPNMFDGLTNPALPQNFGVKQADGDIIVLTSPETVFARDNLKLISERARDKTFLYGHVINAESRKFDNFDIERLRKIGGIEYCGPNKLPRNHPWVFFIGAMTKTDFVELGGIEELFMLGIGCDDTEFGFRALSAKFNLELDMGVFGIHQSHGKTIAEDGRERQIGLEINRSTYYYFFENNKAWQKYDRVVGNINREFGVADSKLLVNSKVIPLKVYPPRPVRKANNVMLHCNQAFWRGGTILFSRDVAKIYPEFYHIICFFYDSREDFEMANEFRNDGIEVCHIEKLTEEIVREIDPAIMMFHNTGGKTVDGEWPYDWLKQWPLIAVHHNRTFPCFHADLDVFVSETILDSYERIKPRMNWKLIPPCMDLNPYEAIDRSPDNKRCVIGKLTSSLHTRFPAELLTILDAVKRQAPQVRFSLVGGSEYWDNITLSQCETPKIGSKTPKEFYKSFDIFVHRNKEGTVDSWGRVISEAMAAGLPVVCENKGGPAEQITHGVDGFLCDDDNDFVKYLVELVNDPTMRYEIGMKARSKSVAEFGIERFRKETSDIILKAALGLL